MRPRHFLLTLFIVLLGSTCSTLAAAPDGSPEAQGHADRVIFENWLGRLRGEERRGADYWAGERSKPRPGPCTTTTSSPEYTSGCQEAQRRLAPADVRRKTEPDYRRGWNAPLSAADTGNRTVVAPVPNAGSNATTERPTSKAEPACDNITVTGTMVAHPANFGTIEGHPNLYDLRRRNPFVCGPKIPFRDIRLNCRGILTVFDQPAKLLIRDRTWLFISTEVEFSTGPSSVGAYIRPEHASCQ